MAQLHRLQEQFGDRLAVISVHSPKFTAEHPTEAVRQAAARHGITHPVVNDARYQLWSGYGVQAWPTVVLIDPLGAYVGSIPGEIDAAELAPILQAMTDQFAARGELADAPLDLPTPPAEPAATLRYPSRLLIDGAGRLVVADTGHGRIACFDRHDGRPLDTLDHPFDDPHGLALAGDRLYVAETGRHSILAVDLPGGPPRRIAGTGELARGRLRPGPALETDLRSPWALAVAGPDRLVVAMAGSHQIWLLEGDELRLLAGDGREALTDGPGPAASFNQPSDLVLQGGVLYVADAEASAIRAVDPLDGATRTLVGAGLFEWGDADGIGPAARLQHPIGLAGDGRLLYVADSYNHKLKTLDPATGEVRTLLAEGLNEPHGLCWHDGLLYVADTNHNRVCVVDPAVGELRLLIG